MMYYGPPCGADPQQQQKTNAAAAAAADVNTDETPALL
jgi:hypothetical protein